VVWFRVCFYAVVLGVGKIRFIYPVVVRARRRFGAVSVRTPRGDFWYPQTDGRISFCVRTPLEAKPLFGAPKSDVSSSRVTRSFLFVSANRYSPTHAAALKTVSLLTATDERRYFQCAGELLRCLRMFRSQNTPLLQR